MAGDKAREMGWVKGGGRTRRWWWRWRSRRSRQRWSLLFASDGNGSGVRRMKLRNNEEEGCVW